MNINQFVEEISAKYGYEENVQKAISLTIPLFLERYKGREEDVYSLFRDVRIFATSDMSEENNKRIEKEMTKGINEHIKEEDTDPYGNDINQGASYSFAPVFDDDMNVVGEVRWLTVAEINDSRKEKYENLFGTNINMPYFLHEINHAFAMQHPSFVKKDDCLFAKHGMFEQVVRFNKEGEYFIEDVISESDIIVEEIINEKITEDMLTSLLGVNSYFDEVAPKLRNIGHVSTSYSSTQILIAEELEGALGREALDSWRIDNNIAIREKFRDMSNSSQITSKYCNGEDAYSFLSNKVYDMYITSCNSYKMNIDDYREKTKRLMFDALAPICGYRETDGKMSLEKYSEVRKNACGDEEVFQAENKVA